MSKRTLKSERARGGPWFLRGGRRRVRHRPRTPRARAARAIRGGAAFGRRTRWVAHDRACAGDAASGTGRAPLPPPRAARAIRGGAAFGRRTRWAVRDRARGGTPPRQVQAARPLPPPGSDSLVAELSEPGDEFTRVVAWRAAKSALCVACLVWKVRDSGDRLKVSVARYQFSIKLACGRQHDGICHG